MLPSRSELCTLEVQKIIPTTWSEVKKMNDVQIALNVACLPLVIHRSDMEVILLQIEKDENGGDGGRAGPSTRFVQPQTSKKEAPRARV